MFYVYIIQSLRNASFYIGSTDNLRRRLQQHNGGASEYTKIWRPWKLIYYEAYTSKQLALRREYSLKKRGKGWQELKKRILEPKR